MSSILKTYPSKLELRPGMLARRGCRSPERELAGEIEESETFAVGDSHLFTMIATVYCAMPHGSIASARKIVVEQRTFFYALRDYESTHPIYFQAHLHRQPQHSLWIPFPFIGNDYTGNALCQGVPLTSQPSERNRVNLHTPGVAAQLITYALHRGWNPAQKSLVIDHGLTVLRELGYEIGS